MSSEEEASVVRAYDRFDHIKRPYDLEEVSEVHKIAIRKAELDLYEVIVSNYGYGIFKTECHSRDVFFADQELVDDPLAQDIKLRAALRKAHFADGEVTAKELVRQLIRNMVVMTKECFPSR